jgi:hypothetical protein
LKLSAINLESGWVTVGYEFEGFEEYIDKKKIQEDKVF